MRTERFRGALLSTLLIASLMALAISLLSLSPSSAAPDGFTPRAPIYIDGNAGFTPGNGVNGGGSGTENDPYIIENWDINASSAPGIVIRNTTAHFVIRNSYVHDGWIDGGGYWGIYFSSVMNGKIDNNTAENNAYGIFLWGTRGNNLISNNIMENNKLGIRLRDSNNNTLSNNTSSGNDDEGIHLWYSNNNTLTNNICENNVIGIRLEESDNNLVENNTAGNNGGGIVLYYSDNNLVGNNLVGNNYEGIYLWHSYNNFVTNNLAENNSDHGIYLYWYSDNNLIYHNEIINNTNQAYDDRTNTWDNGYPSGGNYWSDYTGADSYRGENQDMPGSDGIGDTSYNIPGGSNQDRYPLMNPFPLPWTGWARVHLTPPPEMIPHLVWPSPCLYLKAVVLEMNLALYQGSKLVLKFYTWGDTFQGENVVWSGTTPDNVSFSKIVPHPEYGWVKKVRLDLTYNNTENVISTITSFTVRKVDLEIMFSEIPLRWALALPEERVCLEILFSQIPLYWAMAPS